MYFLKYLVILVEHLYLKVRHYDGLKLIFYELSLFNIGFYNSVMVHN